MKKLLITVVFLSLSLHLFAQSNLSGLGLSIGAGYGHNMLRNAYVADGGDEAISFNSIHGIEAAIRAFPLGSLGFNLRAGVGWPNKIVWENPAYAKIKESTSKPPSQVDPNATPIAGYTPAEIAAIKDFLPNPVYVFTSDDGSLLNIDFSLGVSYQVKITSAFRLVTDLGFGGTYQTLAYERNITELPGDLTYYFDGYTFSLGFDLALGVQYQFMRGFYVELGMTVGYDFWRWSGIEKGLKNSAGTVLGAGNSAYDSTIAWPGYEKYGYVKFKSPVQSSGILSFGLPYLLIGMSF